MKVFALVDINPHETGRSKTRVFRTEEEAFECLKKSYESIKRVQNRPCEPFHIDKKIDWLAARAFYYYDKAQPLARCAMYIEDAELTLEE